MYSPFQLAMRNIITHPVFALVPEKQEPKHENDYGPLDQAINWQPLAIEDIDF